MDPTKDAIFSEDVNPKTNPYLGKLVNIIVARDADAKNADYLKVVKAYVEPSLKAAQPDDKFQFERFGYFVADRKDHTADKPVFNKITGLKDSWGK